MRTKTLFVAALFLTASLYSQNWSLDKSHAKLGFTATHLMVSEVDGFFKTFDIKLTSTNADFSDAVIEVTADVNSIDTHSEQRDNHLKSPDYFDAAKYATINFKSMVFKKVDEKNYKLQGNLTMHGVTRFIELDVIFKGTAIHPYNKKTVAGFKITGLLKRKDFGIGTTTPETIIGDEIQILSNAEFIKD